MPVPSQEQMGERPSRQMPWWLRVFVSLGVTLLVAAGFLVLGGTYTTMQPQTEHTSCTVTDVTANSGHRRTLSSLTVHSDCGKMSAPSSYKALITEGETYDFTVRGWGWEVPVIVDVGGYRYGFAP